jgi:hypothetical protein
MTDHFVYIPKNIDRQKKQSTTTTILALTVVLTSSITRPFVFKFVDLCSDFIISKVSPSKMKVIGFFQNKNGTW